ncbi:MAG: hypothetical protein ABIJ09_00625 [Pseudomonadota bacterium]
MRTRPLRISFVTLLCCVGACQCGPEPAGDDGGSSGRDRSTITGDASSLDALAADVTGTDIATTDTAAMQDAASADQNAPLDAAATDLQTADQVAASDLGATDIIATDAFVADATVPDTAVADSAAPECTPTGNECNDNVACTLDYCEDGHCVFATSNTACDDSVDCTDDVCTATGCVFTPNNANCNDDVDCTADTCHSTLDCQFTPIHSQCSDGVDCTDDTCDAVLGCQFTANDANCQPAPQCKTGGTCHATLDCRYSTGPDFETCDLGGAVSLPNFCLAGTCVGKTSSTLDLDCGDCGCDAWSVDPPAADFENRSGKYLALANWHQDASSGRVTCLALDVTGVFEVGASDTTRWGPVQIGEGTTMGGGLAAATASAGPVLGVIDTSTGTVDWSTGNWINSVVASAELSSIASIQTLTEGQFYTGSNYWLAGQDATTPTTGRLSRCFNSVQFADSCTVGLNTAHDTLTQTQAAMTAVLPYSYSQCAPAPCIPTRYYAGMLLARKRTVATMYKRLHDDANQDRLPEREVSTVTADAEWRGILPWGIGGIAYGTGSVNAMWCDDADHDGATDCLDITGQVGAASYQIIDGTVTARGDLVLLSTGLESYALHMIAAGDAPDDVDSWHHVTIATSRGGSIRSFPILVAGGSDSIYVLMKDRPTSTVTGLSVMRFEP